MDNASKFCIRSKKKVKIFTTFLLSQSGAFYNGPHLHVSAGKHDAALVKNEIHFSILLKRVHNTVICLICKNILKFLHTCIYIIHTNTVYTVYIN